MTENFPNLEKGKDTHIKESQRVPNKMNPKRPTPRYTIIKLATVKDKEEILKATRERVTYKGAHKRPSADFRNISYQKGLA